MTFRNLTVRGWRDYELIDSGDNRKLERFGEVVMIRPETQALWRPTRGAEWKRAVTEFRFSGGNGAWVSTVRGKSLPESWEMRWNEACYLMRLTSFKHTGVFPEQAANWEWLIERIIHAGRMRKQAPEVLNLFGYTGVASIVAARTGGHVTHVDASRQSNEWAKENARRSELPSDAIRYIFDDALRFVEREVRRHAQYDGMIVDPPAFGRGAKGEVWKIEEHLPRLLDGLAKIFNKKPGSFFLLNGYAAGYSPQAFSQAVASAFQDIGMAEQAEYGELEIQELYTERVVPSGIYVRFVR